MNRADNPTDPDPPINRAPTPYQPDQHRRAIARENVPLANLGSRPGGSGGTPVAARGGVVSKSATKAPRGEIGRE